MPLESRNAWALNGALILLCMFAGCHTGCFPRCAEVNTPRIRRGLHTAGPSFALYSSLARLTSDDQAFLRELIQTAAFSDTGRQMCHHETRSKSQPPRNGER